MNRIYGIYLGFCRKDYAGIFIHEWYLVAIYWIFKEMCMVFVVCSYILLLTAFPICKMKTIQRVLG